MRKSTGCRNHYATTYSGRWGNECFFISLRLMARGKPQIIFWDFLGPTKSHYSLKRQTWCMSVSANQCYYVTADLKVILHFKGGAASEWSWALLVGVKKTKIKRSGGSPRRVFMVHSHTAPGEAFKKHFKASSSTWQPFIAWHQKSSLSFLVKILRKGKEFWTKKSFKRWSTNRSKSGFVFKKSF